MAAADNHLPHWPSTLLAQAANIRLVVFDVDGVMTDGRLYFDNAGNEIKAFHSRDGLGLKALMRYGFTVAALTARHSRLVEARMAELSINHVRQGRHDKRAALDELLAEVDLSAHQTAYMGDDLVDWPAMRCVKFKLCPANAESWIAERADYVTRALAGRGAVREACELLLAASGKLQAWRAQFCAVDHQAP
ncbi:MAG: HAD hydrolase family protein [Symploca sp. SIO2G7]|nr:HAD hydrolase family protein [Symploca sp. SIO2G7]